MVNIETYIKETINILHSSIYELTHGKCLLFALTLKEKVGGTLRYLIEEYHVVLDFNGKLYDATGNVTKQYNGCKFLTEKELFQRKTLINELKGKCKD